MILTAILNAILVLGVIVMVITPLVWAILTQHLDHPWLAATHRAPGLSPDRQPRRRAPQPSYKPVTGRT
jgi:ABC-type glycerol-3-phosphate transport system permease component